MADLFGIVVPLACVFGLGMSFALLGSISVKLLPRLNIDQGKFGTMISAFMFTCLLASLVTGVIDSLFTQYDPIHGGFGVAANRPKFPEPSNLIFLLDRWRREWRTGTRSAGPPH